MNTSWVIVTDSTRARIFEKKGANEPLMEFEIWSIRPLLKIKTNWNITPAVVIMTSEQDTAIPTTLL